MNAAPRVRGWSVRWGASVAGLVLLVLVLVVGWPGLQGYWGRDDFFQLALARMVGSPWPLFGSDHYPVPGSVFRPLGFASMWLDTWLLGTSYPAHALADLVLHAAVALALLGLLRRAGGDVAAAALASALFALHPVTLGPALWWSARFDVLASLWLLLALQAGIAWCARPRPLTLLGALLAALAAMASKEIGLIAPALLVLLWLRHAWLDPALRLRAARAIAAAVALTLGFLAWRAQVLGTFGSGLLGDSALGEVLAAGLHAWARDVLGYLSWAAVLAPWQRGALAGALLMLALCCAALVAPRWRREDAPGSRAGAAFARGDLLWCGLGLVLLPALLQAPIARLNAAPLQAGQSAVEAAMQARLYYLGMAGVAIWLGVLLQACRGRVRALAWGAGALLVGALGSAAHEAARASAQRSWHNGASARAAVAAVGRLPLARIPCRIVFIDAPQPPEWGGFVSMDGIVKALATDRGAIGRCWIFEDHTPTWFHLQEADAQPVDALPWTPLALAAAPLAWPRVGALAYAYLVPPAELNLHTVLGTHFLRWQDGRFQDISGDVAAGHVPVRLGDGAPTVPRHN